jgi:hypothetical protein
VVDELEQGKRSSGEYLLNWDTGKLEQGIYYLRMKNSPAGNLQVVIVHSGQ